jgi:hypothetical protein
VAAGVVDGAEGDGGVEAGEAERPLGGDQVERRERGQFLGLGPRLLHLAGGHCWLWPLAVEPTAEPVDSSIIYSKLVVDRCLRVKEFVLSDSSSATFIHREEINLRLLVARMKGKKRTAYD